MKTIPVAVSACLLLVSGAAVAGDQPKTVAPTPMTTQYQDKGKALTPATLTTGQQKSAAAHYAKADANSDCSVTAAELSAMPQIKTDFMTLDLDKDGSLTPAEFAKHTMR